MSWQDPQTLSRNFRQQMVAFRWKRKPVGVLVNPGSFVKAHCPQISRLENWLFSFCPNFILSSWLNYIFDEPVFNLRILAENMPGYYNDFFAMSFFIVRSRNSGTILFFTLFSSETYLLLTQNTHMSLFDDLLYIPWLELLGGKSTISLRSHADCESFFAILAFDSSTHSDTESILGRTHPCYFCPKAYFPLCSVFLA